jgi:hypothetical protein
MATAGAAIASVTVVEEAIVAAAAKRPIAAILHTAARPKTGQWLPIPAGRAPAQAGQQWRVPVLRAQHKPHLPTPRLRTQQHRTQQHRTQLQVAVVNLAAAAAVVDMKAVAVVVASGTNL